MSEIFSDRFRRQLDLVPAELADPRQSDDEQCEFEEHTDRDQPSHGSAPSCVTEPRVMNST